MEHDEDVTVVVFRVGTRGIDDVFALFPDIDAGKGYVGCYQHVGQHGGADYTLCVRSSRPATPAEYAELKAELEGLGYKLDVRTRRPRKHWWEHREHYVKSWWLHN